MNTFFKCLFTGVVGAGLMVGASSANASSVPELLEFFETNTLSDDNRQIHIDRNESGLLDVGDSIRGVVLIDQLFNPSGPAAGYGLGRDSGNDEFTGIFQLQVLTKEATGDAEFPWRFTFGPDADFIAEFGVAQGTMALLYTDPSNNMQLDSNQATAEATATDGQLVWTLGFTGEDGTPGAGEGWVGRGGDNLNALANLDPGEAFGLINFGVSRTSEDGLLGTLPILPRTSARFGTGAEFLGASTIRGIQGLDTWAQVAGDLTMTVTPIPLPAAVWSGVMVLGALGGFGWLKRRPTAVQAA